MGWAVPMNFTASVDRPLMMENSFMLDPKDHHAYIGNPYPMGIDPIWQGASNKIGFLNTFKMKISLIFGIIHMTFGVLLSLWNKISKKQYSHIILEFLPQLI